MLPSTLLESPAHTVTALAQPRRGAARPRSPVTLAASRVFGASAALGLLAGVWVLFVLTRLLATWKLAPADRVHPLTLLGERFSYPVANADAVIVLALATLGAQVLLTGAYLTVRELRAQWRFRRVLAPVRMLPGERAWVIETSQPQAFCGGLLRPRVYVSTGALELLDERELRAVIAHERHHAERRDPLRLACGRVLAGALFFLPALARLARRQYELAEMNADTAAVAGAGADRSALASAMLSFCEAGGPAAVGIDPERVDCLLGAPPRTSLPAALCLSAAAMLAGLTGVALLAAHGAAGSLTLGLPLLSAQPCVLVLATIPLTVCLLAVIHRQTPSRSQ